MKHKRFDTKNFYFSNTYLLKVSTKDTGTGANTHSIHPYHRVRAYMLSNSTIKRLKKKHKDAVPVSLSLSLSKHVLLKIVMFWHNITCKISYTFSA